jgi:phage terminase large subunit
MKMTEVEINVIQKIWDFLEEANAKNVIIYGGAGAGKSYTLAQFLILRILIPFKNKRLLVTRKYNPSLKLSAYQLIKEILEACKIPYDEFKSQQLIKLENDSEIIFRGMDDPEKIKSTEFNYIWMEEATEFDVDDYNQLRLRLRRANAGQRNQMFLTFNPIGKTNWVYKTFFEQKPEDTQILHVNYKDNPFLDKEYVEMLKNLEGQDKTFYQVYTLGEFAEFENLIYTNYDIVNEVLRSYDEIIYGLDFGYNNPTALVEIRIKDKEFYITEKLYRTHLTNADLIEQLKMLNIRGYIYADSSEPDRIKEIEEAGFVIYPAAKNVKAGIDFVKRQKLHIYKGSVNLIKEIQNYKWREDRNGNVIDEPVKFMDHTMDALRYAIYSHFSRPELGIEIIKF